MAIQTLKSNDVRRDWGTILEYALKGGITIIQRYKRDAAVIIGFDEYDRLKRAEADTLNRRSEEVKEGNYIPWEEVENALG